MSVTASFNVIPAQLWPQGDARDPLGTWGARGIVVGDGSGGQMEILISVPEGLSGAFVYTVYALTFSQISVQATLFTANVFVRLLTNWPDIDVLAGVQGFSTARLVGTPTPVTTFTDPEQATTGDMLDKNDRFILLGDPRPSAGAHDIVSMRLGQNINLETMVVEAYGYYWDREVRNTPGGPRHPGSS